MGGIRKLFFALTMTQAAVVEYYSVLNSPLWYISCLMMLYLVTPPILSLFGKIRKKPGILLMIAIALYGIILGQIKTWQFVVGKELFTYRFAFILFYGTPYCRLTSYLLGIVAELLFENTEKLWILLKEKTATCWEIILIVMVVGAYFWGMTKERYIYASWVYVPVLLLLIFLFAAEKGKISKILTGEISQKLGKMSMYLYIIHYVIINCGGSKLLELVLGVDAGALFITLILLLTVCFMGAYGIWCYEEYRIKKRE